MPIIQAKSFLVIVYDKFARLSFPECWGCGLYHAYSSSFQIERIYVPCYRSEMHMDYFPPNNRALFIVVKKLFMRWQTFWGKTAKSVATDFCLNRLKKTKLCTIGQMKSRSKIYLIVWEFWKISYINYLG